MALARVKIWFGLMLALLIAAGLGCGLKAPPEPYFSLAPKAVTSISVRPVSDGVQVSFALPAADKPSRAIAKVRVSYTYRPLDSKPPCPDCPANLPNTREMTLDEKQASGAFAFIDKEAPLDKVAYYQVVLIDGAGRESQPSAVAWAPRLAPPAQVTGLKANPADGVVNLSWSPVAALKGGGALKGLAGYLVYRRADKKTALLNVDPVKETSLVDRAVVNGQTYAYRVSAVRTEGKHTLAGQASEWVEAVPADLTPPPAPGELAAVSTPGGIFLKFTAVTADDLAGYLVFRRQGTDGPWQKLTPDPQVENGYVDKDVKPEVTYQYRVQAVDKKGNASQPSQPTEVLHEP
jgi:hypothetical protein